MSAGSEAGVATKGAAAAAASTFRPDRFRRGTLVMRSLISSGFAMIAVVALIAAPAAARNGTGQVRVPFTERHHHASSHGYFAPYWAGATDEDGADALQNNPANTAFPTQSSPTADTRTPATPYKPPSVDIAPGGIEIIRGPGAG